MALESPRSSTQVMIDGRGRSGHHPVEDLLQDLLSDQLVDLERRKERKSCAKGQPESVAMHQSDLEVSERWLLVPQRCGVQR